MVPFRRYRKRVCCFGIGLHNLEPGCADDPATADLLRMVGEQVKAIAASNFAPGKTSGDGGMYNMGFLQHTALGN